ncbi:putative methylthioribulose-1-phosphate dehydratase [Oesophagostomum dentatum]|uniref:Putative methylthioribulose-1-phosphate dehydratase n=1 Tax=Oesophagostomum dentatum TaxID=61180 RepID=A0A0B1SPH2_OESDE|nr:putative methylthioribulose-1-phosphate dehydratase [Oesophagostomum dentatum]
MGKLISYCANADRSYRTCKFYRSDIFVYDLRTKQQVQRPSHAKVDVSSCSVLFSLIMRQTGSKCVIHTHGKCANLVTQLLKSKDVFEISHQEYIKGIYDPFTGKNLNYEDTLTIPIIENQPKEDQLLPAVEECLLTNQRTCALLVRNHGLFVWGLTWEKAKIMTECIDYLLDLSIEMTRHNIPLVKEDAAMERSTNPDEEYRHIFYSQ